MLQTGRWGLPGNCISVTCRRYVQVTLGPEAQGCVKCIVEIAFIVSHRLRCRLASIGELYARTIKVFPSSNRLRRFGGNFRFRGLYFFWAFWGGFARGLWLFLSSSLFRSSRGWPRSFFFATGDNLSYRFVDLSVELFSDSIRVLSRGNSPCRVI